MIDDPAPRRSPLSVTAVLPALDEAENLVQLLPELALALATSFQTWEILVVDDGSTDGTPEVLAAAATSVENLSWIRLRRTSGKSEALRQGLSRVTTDLVLLVDADGQDDPAEIPTLLTALEEGADLVTGARQQRQDRFVKRATSRLYNWCTARVTGVPGSDFNSGFKLVRAEVTDQVDLYGELHRYLPVLAVWAGYAVAEVPVKHRVRRHGKTKYGVNRFWRGLLDLLTVKFITTYDTRPFHLIGGLGLTVLAGGIGLLAWMLVERLSGATVGDRPALLAGITLAVVGVQLVSVGLLAELMVALYRRSRREGSTGAEPVRSSSPPDPAPGTAPRRSDGE